MPISFNNNNKAYANMNIKVYETNDFQLRGSGKLCLTNIQIVFMIGTFSGTVYSCGLKFLHINYESFECDIPHEFFYSWFQ